MPVVFLTSGTTWTVPSDWNSSDNTIEVIGGGGGGAQGNQFGGNPGGGGGGGAYSKISNLSLTPLASVTIQIGAAGAENSSGGDTWFNGASLGASSVGAKGGVGASSTFGQNGGDASSGIGTTKYSGGNGGTSISGVHGGGGGGAAGLNGAGNNAFTGSGQYGQGGSGDAGSGGAGGDASTNTPPGNGTEWSSSPAYGSGGGGFGSAVFNVAGSSGGNYGAGGGGAVWDNGAGYGGAGTQGLIVITYGATTALSFTASDANIPTFATSGRLPAFSDTFVVSDANKPIFTAAESTTANPFNLIWLTTAPTPTFAVAENTSNILPSVIAPIVAMMQYTPSPGSVSGYVAHLIAFTLDFLGNAQVIDVSNPTWSGALALYTNAGPVVGGTQFSDSAIFAMGLNIPPQLYRGLPVTTITNTFQSSTNYPPWLLDTQYPKGSRIVAAATPDTGQSYIFQAVHGGTSGPTEPAFPSGFHVRVSDNGVTWRNDGAAGPPGPLGAGFVFNHLSSLWVWGTASNYPQTGLSQGLVGPDGLWMSDIGNPTSYDPANTAYIGQGDGQAAMGGGVWSQLEVGIPATPQLILFKSNATYSVLGAFPAVSIANIPDGVGCAAPNTVQFVPGVGLMRLANPGVAVFDGTRDQVDKYTDPIRPYLFPIKGANPDITPVDWGNIIRGSSCQTLNPPGYLMLLPLQNSNGALTRGFFFDRQLRAWTIIDYPFSMPLACGFYYTRSGNQYRSLFGGFSDGIIRQGFTGDEYWDTEPNQPILWSFRYPPSGAPATPIYVRRSLLRAVLRGSQALIRSMQMLFQDANGREGQTPVMQSIDATNLSSSFDIDAKVLGGMSFDIFGAGGILAQGLEIDYESKPPTRIPQ
jgi:hypothetical protein